MPTPTFTKSGGKATTAAKLNKDVFGVEVKSHGLLKQAYVAYQANGRENLSKTLRRGEVRGGGKKPWKQKGTGRARFGSIRVPIWRGGGITFGPLGNENYTRNLNKKAKQQAIRQALTVNANNVSVIESFEVSSGKTKDAASLLKKLGVQRKVLIVVDTKDAMTAQAVQNIEGVTYVQATYLNVFDIMNADHIVVTKKALDAIDAWLGGKK